MSREVYCACGAVVKVNNYGLKAKKNKKNIAFSSVYEDIKYQCSKCRGINTPKKKGVGNARSKQDVGKRTTGGGTNSKSKGDGQQA